MAEETFTLKVDSSGAVTSMKRIGTEFDKTGKKADNFGKSTGKADAGLSKLAKTALAAGGAVVALTAVAKAATASVQSFSEYEKALVGVAKTTNLAGDELKTFSVDIQQLSKDLKGAASSKELLAIAQAAGQLGVTGTANLLKFSETIAKLGLASDLAGDQAATSLTRILTVTGQGVGEIDIFASQIVALGNNFAATESEIARVATEVSRSTAVFKTTAGEAAAIAAALKSVGVQAELGGSAVGRTFRAIDSAVRNGGQALDDFAELTGKTGNELKTVFGQSSVRAFQLFLEGLGRISTAGGDTTEELAKFNLKGEEILKVLPVLAQNSELVGRALKTIADEAKNGGEALKKETAVAVDTLGVKVKDLEDRFDGLLTTIGGRLSNAATVAVDALTTAVDFLNESLKVTESFNPYERQRVAAAKLAETTAKLADEERRKLEAIQNAGGIRILIEDGLLAKKELGIFALIKQQEAEEKILKTIKDNEIIKKQMLEFQKSMSDLALIEAAAKKESVVSEQSIARELERPLSISDKILDTKKKETSSLAQIIQMNERQVSIFDKLADREKEKFEVLEEEKRVTADILQMNERQNSIFDKLADKEKEKFEIIKDEKRVTADILQMNERQVSIFDKLADKSRDITPTATLTTRTAGGGGELFGLDSPLGITASFFAGGAQTFLTAVEEFVNALDKIETQLELLAKLPDIIDGFIDRLPQRLSSAITGSFETALKTFSGEFISGLGTAVFEGVQKGLLSIFGISDAGQTVEETGELKALADSIKGQQKSIEQAGWTNSEWQSEVTRISGARAGLNRKQENFWEEFIDLATEEFDAIKQLNDTQTEALSVLKGVLNSLEDTINSLLGSTLNPDQTFASAQAAYNDLVEKATAGGLSPAEREQAVGDLTGFVTGFLEKAQEQFGSSAEFQNIFSGVLSDLGTAGDIVSAEASASESAVNGTDALLSNILTEIEGAQEAPDDVANPLEELLEVIGFIWDFLDGFARAALTAIEGFLNAIGSVLDSIEKILGGVGDTFKNVSEKALEITEEATSVVEGATGIDTGATVKEFTLDDEQAYQLLLIAFGKAAADKAFPNRGRDEEILDFVTHSAADGGVFAGPTSGFPMTLHGTEAVIPLKNGSVPVNIGGGIVEELKMQNQLLMQLIGVTSSGLTIDGRSFSKEVSNIATNSFKQNMNRGRFNQALVS